MVKGMLLLGVFLSLMLAAGSSLFAQEQATADQEARSLTVYKSPT